MIGPEIIQQVRERDYERFLCIQLAAPEKRAALYAMTALSTELAQIAEIVSEPLIGHIRLAWWREALEEIAAGKPSRNHPVVLALASLDHALFPLLHEMIEARAADLDASMLTTDEQWFAYLDHTAGALHLAWALALYPALDASTHLRIRAEARAYAMVGLMRAIPYLAHHRFQRLPRSRIDLSQFETCIAQNLLAPAVAEIVAMAKGLVSASSYNADLRPISGLRALTELFIQKLQRQAANPQKLRIARPRLVWRIMRTK